MNRIPVILLVLLTSAANAGTVEVDDHLFVLARIVDCGDVQHIIDHTQVAQSGEAVFANGFRVQAVGLSTEEIAISLAKEIGAKTGHTPTSLVVEVLPAADAGNVERKLWTLLHEPTCGSKSGVPSDAPPPIQNYNRRIASDTRAIRPSGDIG